MKEVEIQAGEAFTPKERGQNMFSLSHPLVLLAKRVTSHYPLPIGCSLPLRHTVNIPFIIQILSIYLQVPAGAQHPSLASRKCNERLNWVPVSSQELMALTLQEKETHILK